MYRNSRTGTEFSSCFALAFFRSFFFFYFHFFVNPREGVRSIVTNDGGIHLKARAAVT
jgi:hypothetical protein